MARTAWLVLHDATAPQALPAFHTPVGNIFSKHAVAISSCCTIHLFQDLDGGGLLYDSCSRAGFANVDDGSFVLFLHLRFFHLHFERK